MATPTLGNPDSVPTSSVLANPGDQDTAPDSTSTSSYDYWWPYPPQGATTTSTTESASTTLLTDSILLLSPSLVPSTTSNVISTDSSSALSSTSIAPSAPSSSFSIIRITASIPSSSSTSPTAGSSSDTTSHVEFKLMYLVPVFAVLGAITGAVLTNWAYNRWSRRKSSTSRSRELSTGGGGGDGMPDTYSTFMNQSEKEDEDARFEERHLQYLHPSSDVVERDVLRTPSSFGPYVVQPPPHTGTWLHRALSKPLRARAKELRLANLPVTPSRMVKYQLTDTHEHVEGVRSPVVSAREEIIRSPVSRTIISDEDDEDYDRVPEETVRHKSIRRGIMERIQFGSMKFPPRRTASHKSKASESMDGSSFVGKGLDDDWISVTPQRDGRDLDLRRNRTNASSIHHGRARSEYTVQDYLNEKPLPIPTDTITAHSPQETTRGKTVLRRKGSLRRLEEGSGYGLHALQEQFVPDSKGEDTNQDEAAKSSVLPGSPPTVWSPSLASELIFSPTDSVDTRRQTYERPPTRSPPSRVSGMSSPPLNRQHIKDSIVSPRPTKSPISLPVTRVRTIHGPRTPTRRGTYKSTVSSTIGSPTKLMSPVSSRSPRSPDSPAQRFYARQTANSKVDGILSSSYSREFNAGSSK